MKIKKLVNFSLLAKRYWISTYTPEAVFTYTSEEAVSFQRDITEYFNKTRKIVYETLDLNYAFSIDDLLHHLKNAQASQNQERLHRIDAACTEITDEEFRCFAEFVCLMDADLSASLQNLKIYLVMRIWNSAYGVYDPKTNLLIEHYLKDDTAFAEELAEICHRGINNPGFCRWIINNWNLCRYYYLAMKKELSENLLHFEEQKIILKKIKALE